MKYLMIITVLAITTQVCFSQMGELPVFDITSKDYSDFAAIFYKDQMLVDEYSSKGKCNLEQGMEGKLSLNTVFLSQFGATPKASLGFHVAIHHKDTNTIWQLTKEPVTEIMLEDVLKECKEGDSIIFLTTDKKYSLPHPKIEVMWGC